MAPLLLQSANGKVVGYGLEHVASVRGGWRERLEEFPAASGSPVMETHHCVRRKALPHSQPEEAFGCVLRPAGDSGRAAGFSSLCPRKHH